MSPSGEHVARQTLWQGLLVADAAPQLKGLNHHESAADDPGGEEDRRNLAERRKAAFAKEPTGPNRVWQLDFSLTQDAVRRRNQRPHRC